MWWHGDGWSWWAWLAMSLTMLAFWTIVILVAVTAVRRAWAGERRSRALDVLDERYARGEIDEEEYRRRRDHLVGGRG